MFYGEIIKITRPPLKTIVLPLGGRGGIMIVCKALENATDYDLKNFKEIMEKYLKPISNENRIVFPQDFSELDEFKTTCDWCVYNRIFISHMGEWEEMKEGTFDMSTYYYMAKPAAVLLKYLNNAHQIWNY